MASISDLDAHCLHKIFRHLSAKEAARNMLVDKSWNEALRDDLLWKKLAYEDWGISTPVSVSDSPLPSSRVAYADWQKEVGMYNGPDRLPQRAAKVWRELKSWLAVNIPDIANTLQPGLCEEEMDDFEQRHGMTMPPALRIQYRFCGGQAFEVVHAPRFAACSHWNDFGLFGGCQYYNQMPGVAFVDMDSAEDLISGFKGELLNYCPFASVGETSAAYVVNRTTGQVQIMGENCVPYFDCIPLSPKGTGMMEWMEVFAQRVTGGGYLPARLKLQDPGHPQALESSWKYLSKYPQTAEAGMKEAITHGVRVRVGAAVMPHTIMTNGRPSERHMYSYRVSFSLLPAEQQKESWPASSGIPHPRARVQLKSRCWNITKRSGEVVDVVAGPGVVGLYPVLTAGGPEFSYESCSVSSQDQREASSMSGFFTFVEGLISNPEGADFNVECPKFELSMQPYTY